MFLTLCNNCDTLMWDGNPSSKSLDVSNMDLPDGIMEQAASNDGENFPHCCPNCLTDGYLSDTTEDNFDAHVQAHLA